MEAVKVGQSVIEVCGGKTVTSPTLAVLLRHRKKELYRFSVHYTTLVKKIIAKLPLIDLRMKMDRIFEEYKKFCIETKRKIRFRRENFPQSWWGQVHCLLGTKVVKLLAALNSIAPLLSQLIRHKYLV